MNMLLGDEVDPGLLAEPDYRALCYTLREQKFRVSDYIFEINQSDVFSEFTPDQVEWLDYVFNKIEHILYTDPKDDDQ